VAQAPERGAAGARWPALSRESLVRLVAGAAPALLVAAGVFLLALNDGTYQVSARTSVAIGIWWTVAVGVALRLLPRQRVPTEAWVVGGALALLGAFSALSMSWADSAEGAFAELDRSLIYVGMFALVVMATRRGDAARWIDGLALGITAVGLLALTSELFPGSVGPDAPPAFFPGESRLSYPLNYWNGLAILVGIAFPLLLGAATARRPAWARGLALAPLPALTAVIYLSSSRGGAATALLGMVVFLLLAGRRIPALAATVVAGVGVAGATAVMVSRHALADGPIGSSAATGEGHGAALLLALLGIGCAAAYAGWCAVEPRRPLRVPRATSLGLAAAGLIACVLAIAAVHPVEKFEDFKRPSSEQSVADSNADFTRAHLLSSNGSGRWQLWEGAVDEWKDAPLVGKGAGSYESWWAQNGSISKFVRNAHSLYLETLGELGLVGFVILMTAFGAGFVAAARRLLRSAGHERTTIAALTGALVAYMAGAGIDWMWELTVVTLIGVTCLALLAGPATDPASDVRRVPRRRLAPRAAVMAACAVAICVEGILLLSHARLQESQSAAARGDIDAARSAALDARSLQPWASSPDLQLALLEEQSRDLPAARTRIGEAIDHDKSNWRLWFVSARIETEAGNIPKARSDLRRAKSLNPRSPLFAR
jgi:O-Antigen ligase